MAEDEEEWSTLSQENRLNKLRIASTSAASSYFNSPEKQNSNSNSNSSRWTIPREERRKILELMERSRDDQKRRKKKDWCRLENDKTTEFEEVWSQKNDERINHIDIKIMKMDEGRVYKDEEIDEKLKLKRSTLEPENKKVRTTPELNSNLTIESRSRIRNETDININNRHRNEIYTEKSHEMYVIADFDCIEELLTYLAGCNSPSFSIPARFILRIADDLYKSEVLFHSHLKDFDQPFFLYYHQDDDNASLKGYNFEGDDFGRFVRNQSYRDKSRKFYRERAYRHRCIAQRSYQDFFNDSILLKLREEIQRLDRNCEEFHFWMTQAITKKDTLFISTNPLLRAFALLLVLSRNINATPLEISRKIWSEKKFGPEWTITENLNNRSEKLIKFLTTQKESKLSIAADRLGLQFFK